MEPICRDVIEPMQDIIENLIALPARCKQSIKRRKGGDAGEGMQSGCKPRSRAREDSSAADPHGSSHDDHVSDAVGELVSHETTNDKEQKRPRIAAPESPDRRNAGRIYDIPIGRILSEGNGIRRGFDDPQLPPLADSIRRNGVLTPIVVCAQTPDIPYGDARAYFSLIRGARRLSAAAAIGEESIPCIVLESEDLRAEALAILENLQTERLGIFDAAASIAALGDLGIMTREQIACVLSLSKSAVANKQRLLHLNAKERTIIQSAALTERHARAFLRIKDARQRTEAVRLAAKMQWNVAATEAYIDTLPLPSASPVGTTGEARGKEDSTDTPADTASVTQNPRRKCVLHSLDAFFGTIDRCVAVLREAGIETESERREETDGIRLSLFIPTAPPSPSPTSDVSRETPAQKETAAADVTEP